MAKPILRAGIYKEMVEERDEKIMYYEALLEYRAVKDIQREEMVRRLRKGSTAKNAWNTVMQAEKKGII